LWHQDAIQNNMKNTLLLPLLLLCTLAHSQKWVEKTYSIQTTPDVAYGTATDFAGNLRTLRMDIAVPTGDVPPICGRPLLVVVHGGAFLGGDKSEGTIQNLMKDFAQRGYTTAAVNYRLGMFQTHLAVHCNVTQLFNTPWDCMNMADTAEWYRGAYRAMQDVRGAIRYLVNNRSTYQIDPNNVFLVGESAGGFTVLNAAYLDSPSEKHAATQALPDVLPPNKIYEQPCVQQFKWDTNIISMKLQRPDLGPIEGTTNPFLTAPYTLRGVGSLYGATLGDLFSENTHPEPPALYMFHQPNDLIVPFKKHRVLEPFAYCLTQFPANCSNIINRPFVCGSQAIATQLEALKSQGKKVPKYLFEATNNGAGCVEQFTDPNKVGHALDNYALRTGSMASFFAPLVAPCGVSSADEAAEFLPGLTISPNPARDVLTVVWDGTRQVLSAALVDTAGRVISRKNELGAVRQFQMDIGPNRSSGAYALLLTTERGVVSRVVVCR